MSNLPPFKPEDDYINRWTRQSMNTWLKRPGWLVALTLLLCGLDWTSKVVEYELNNASLIFLHFVLAYMSICGICGLCRAFDRGYSSLHCLSRAVRIGLKDAPVAVWFMIISCTLISAALAGTGEAQPIDGFAQELFSKTNFFTMVYAVMFAFTPQTFFTDLPARFFFHEKADMRSVVMMNHKVSARIHGTTDFHKPFFIYATFGFVVMFLLPSLLAMMIIPLGVTFCYAAYVEIYEGRGLQSKQDVPVPAPSGA